MVSCAVRTCCRRDGVDKKKTSGITFHRFPKDTARREVWEKFVNRRGWKPTKYSVLCSQHFCDEYFDRTSMLCVRLRQDAIPTLNQVETAPPKEILSNIIIIPPYQVSEPGPSTSDSPSTASLEEQRPITPMTVSTPFTSPTSSCPLEVTPRKRKLLEKLHYAESVSTNRKRKLILLQRQIARRNKKIANMKKIISELKKKTLWRRRAWI